MNWLKENINIVLVVAVVLLSVGLSVNGLIKENNSVKITIEAGDTLSSLSEKYRGDMSKGDWLSFVTNYNGMKDDRIIAGKDIWIPKTNEYNTNIKEIASDR